MRLCGVIVTALSLTAPAFADPCEGALPKQAGSKFSGQVRYIVDGDGFCVSDSADPNTWIEVRMVDFNAPELATDAGKLAKTALERLISGRSIACTTTAGRNGKTSTYDRVLARCTLDRRSLGDAMRAAGIAEGGN